MGERVPWRPRGGGLHAAPCVRGARERPRGEPPSAHKKLSQRSRAHGKSTGPSPCWDHRGSTTCVRRQTNWLRPTSTAAEPLLLHHCLCCERLGGQEWATSGGTCWSVRELVLAATLDACCDSWQLGARLRTSARG